MLSVEVIRGGVGTTTTFHIVPTRTEAVQGVGEAEPADIRQPLSRATTTPCPRQLSMTWVTLAVVEVVGGVAVAAVLPEDVAGMAAEGVGALVVQGCRLSRALTPATWTCVGKELEEQPCVRCSLWA